ncbi:dihydrolipoyllysine-residue acetyltransferase [Vandammella animalimorsus]|uniref:Acetyltransferase component of pyruvate dehydrogenase complex n=1 Tax=Vandammella animalimorsus TaxID=2029117 RepID=A0A2A2T5U5_9BURK|nr:dihydrolipoyllysine-residue acetyltransferase [Vandammella animalimorsus]PAX16834.1 dihydrolipoyllysine-residue acetyltransferase [Vandammella animalimorsus]PAX20367.1 dihydrolipoyllysine-residue acetyltransferase [Vandammella animalimorsus]
MALVEVKVPDIGDFSDVAVIELLVQPGDAVKAEQSLITVESDKASMEIPSSHAGVVKELKVKLGDKVSEGAVVLLLEAEGAEEKTAPAPAAPAQAAIKNEASAAPAEPAPAAAAPAASGPVEVRVPDIGDFKDVAVIEVFVQPGDTVKVEQSLITVESDKASMEIPSSHAGVVKEMKVKLGDKLNMGDVIAVLEAAAPPVQRSASGVERESAPAPAAASAAAASASSPSPAQAGEGRAVANAGTAAPAHDPTKPPLGLPHASPSVRKFARELGVPLAEVKGSGPKGRITQQDVQQFTQAVMAGSLQTQAQAARAPASSAGVGGAGLDLLPWPKVDFAKFGPVEAKPLSRIKKISGANLARNWVMIPHVTNHDDADITELEALRVQLNKENEKSGVKVTMLAFLIKACVAALKKFPEFNASLDGDNLVYKQYWNIGFAADTPNGLVVPVIKQADAKGVMQISQELAELSKKARDGKASPADMQGATFTISSLGGIGGTYFTPIINAPEVAILGVCRSEMRPRWNGEKFKPRLMLPLSLSYDHRVIDGAAAARFNAYLAQVLADFRRVML